MASNNAVAAEVSTAVTKLNEHLATALNGADATAGAANNTTVITLAGENSGATMEAEDLVVVGNADAEEEENDEDHDQQEEEDVVISAYTNNNYQAVNYSVLVSGSCAVNDPGVHVVVVEHVDEIRDYDDDLDSQEF